MEDARSTIPQLTAKQAAAQEGQCCVAYDKVGARRKRELAKLASQSDSTIDLSEIPEATDEFWQRAVRNPFYRPAKKQITLRLDADVIACLRKQGKGIRLGPTHCCATSC